jgi:hypothetical protein
MDVAEYDAVLSIGSGRSVDALSRRLFRCLETHCMQRARRNSGPSKFHREFNFHLFLSFENRLALPEFQNI